MLADIFLGARVLESGVGSGALSMTLVLLGAVVTGYELREDFANRAARNVATFLGDAALERYRVEHRDAYDGIDESTSTGSCSTCPSRGRWSSMRPGRCTGACSSPTPADHAGDPARDELAAQGFGMVDTIEVLNRAGTSRGSRSVPTTAWWPTPASSPARGC